ncbi:MAG: ABC transporter permease subunit [Acidimicrobiia bacterium]|nr:ABC transporter permease [Acidimicrobiia bacterium]NNK91797.1 ABC transporter permease subunit [Acidimicrobiia bacterium]
MLRSVFTKTIFDRRRGLIGWTMGMAALVVMVIAFYPSIAGQREQLEDLFESYPDSLLALMGVESAADILSPVGYLNSQLFANVVLLIVLIFAIGAGTAATAGEERDGTLDLLLAQPISRTRVLIDKLGSITVMLAGIIAVSFVALVIGGPLASLDVGISGLVAVHFGTLLLALLFATLAMFIGGLTGSRGIALGITAGIAVIAYFMYGLFPVIDALAPHQDISPFYWLLGENPLANGVPWRWFGQLAGFTALFLAGAIWGFGNRDTGT